MQTAQTAQAALRKAALAVAATRAREIEKAIHHTKEFFGMRLSCHLNLQKISAPLFVSKDSGVQDNLGGTERPVAFDAKSLGQRHSFEVVQSLAKWKRLALSHYGFPIGEGLVTDMKALRPDEEKLSAVHSIYVDQWDWEKVIAKEDRTLDTLKSTVRFIFEALKDTEQEVYEKYGFVPILPSHIFFIHAEELLALYPDKTAKQREYEICKKYGAVFIIGIGGKLKDGKAHDLRAPDYDDWSLNGDILVWNPILKDALELSSMGIRVDPKTLESQLSLSGHEERKKLQWHQLLLQEKLPLTIGGGIGQSRVAMFMLRRQHIGEVQVSAWSDEDQLSFSAVGAHFLGAF